MRRSAGAAQTRVTGSSGSRGRCASLLEALPAKNRPSLSWFEGHSRLLAAARTISPGLNPRPATNSGRSQGSAAFRLAALTALGFVLELLVVEKQLFTGGKDEVGATIYTLKNLVLEFHGELLPSARGSRVPERVSATCSRTGLSALTASRNFQCPVTTPFGFGPPRANAWLLRVRLRNYRMKFRLMRKS